MQYPTAYKLERACFWMLKWHQLKWYFSKLRYALKILALLGYVSLFIRLQIMFDKSIVKYLLLTCSVEETDEVAKKCLLVQERNMRNRPSSPFCILSSYFDTDIIHIKSGVACKGQAGLKNDNTDESIHRSLCVLGLGK